jgi:hypothetical protein
MKFKIGDTVRNIKNTTDSDWNVLLGNQGLVTGISIGAEFPYEVNIEGHGKCVFKEEELELVDTKEHGEFWKEVPELPYCGQTDEEYEEQLADKLENERIMEEAKEKAKAIKTSEQLIIEECDELKKTLLEKNRLYGDSVFDPGIFNIDPVIGIKCRLQDKLNRLKSAQLDDQEDVTKDILGYIILLRIAEKRK